MKQIIDKANKFNFTKQLIHLKKRYKNKKIVIYGAGKFFHAIKTHFDLSDLNIIAVADKKFLEFEEYYDKDLGYNVISPLKIADYKPDIVLLAVECTFFIEKYIVEEVFKQSKKFRYRPLVEEPLEEKMRLAWLPFM